MGDSFSAKLDYPMIDNNGTVKTVEIFVVLFWSLFFIFNIILIILYQHKYYRNPMSITMLPLLMKLEILLRTYLFSHFFVSLITLSIAKFIGRPTPNYYKTLNIES